MLPILPVLLSFAAKRWRRACLPAALMMLVLLSAGGCFSSNKAVHFSEAWPAQADDYEDATSRWTRRGLLRASLADQGSQLLELYATFFSTEWRAAYVREQADLQKLNAASKEALRAEQEATGKAFHEFQLLVSTYHPQHNDLHRERSIWRVVLVDASGREIPAESIERDRRPRQLIRAEFQNFGDFAEGYRVRFPYVPELLSGKKFSLRISSSLGTLEVDWEDE